MIPRIQLDESGREAPLVPAVNRGVRPPSGRHLLEADWEDPTSETLMLYVADDPQIGDEFSYHGLSWRIVDYRNGWVARLLVG